MLDHFGGLDRHPDDVVAELAQQRLEDAARAIVAHADDDAAGIAKHLDRLAEPQVLRRAGEGNGSAARRAAQTRCSSAATEPTGSCAETSTTAPSFRCGNSISTCRRTASASARSSSSTGVSWQTQTTSASEHGRNVGAEGQRAGRDARAHRVRQVPARTAAARPPRASRSALDRGRWPTVGIPAAAVQAAVTEPRCHRPKTASFMSAARTPSGSAASQSTVRNTPSRMVSFGFHPSARMRSRVEQDERAVADPAALAARIGQLRADAEALRNPADRVVDAACFVGAEIEDMDLVVEDADREQHRVDAVVHVEIGFALLAVAEHVKLRRVVAQLLVEVEDVAVRVALAEDRDEAEDVGLESEALAVGLDHAFGGQLRGAVERGLEREGRVLRRRKYLRLAVDRAGRRERHALARRSRASPRAR